MSPSGKETLGKASPCAFSRMGKQFYDEVNTPPNQSLTLQNIAHAEIEAQLSNNFSTLFLVEF